METYKARNFLWYPPNWGTVQYPSLLGFLRLYDLFDLGGPTKWEIVCKDLQTEESAAVPWISDSQDRRMLILQKSCKLRHLSWYLAIWGISDQLGLNVLWTIKEADALFDSIYFNSESIPDSSDCQMSSYLKTTKWGISFIIFNLRKRSISALWSPFLRQ